MSEIADKLRLAATIIMEVAESFDAEDTATEPPVRDDVFQDIIRPSLGTNLLTEPGDFYWSTEWPWADRERYKDSRGYSFVDFTPKADDFHEQFATDLKAVAGTVRVMNSLGVNKTYNRDLWVSEEPIKNAWTLAGLVEMANKNGVRLWVCLHHELFLDKNHDDLIRVIEILNRLDAAPIIEYSNEVWNSIFPQYRFHETHGKTVWSKEKIFTALIKSQASFAAEKMKIVLRETQGAFVVGGQLRNPWVTKTVAEAWIAEGLRPAAVAIAPYVRCDQSVESPEHAVKQLSNDLTTVKTFMEDTAKLGFPVVAYEGGHEMIGEDPDLDVAARMRDTAKIIFQMIDYHFALGGGLFCHFGFTRQFKSSGRYGCVEVPGEERSEIFQVLESIHNANL